MRQHLRSIADIRPGERALTALMFANIVAIMITYYFLKPARDSLFIDSIGASQLPVVFMLIAVVSAPIAGLYSRASRTLKLNRLINLTLLAMVVSLAGFYSLISRPPAWVPYLFYMWVSVFGALVVSQFWLLANGVFTATQAKRIFPTLTLGAIIGAWIGGELTSQIAYQLEAMALGMENLLIGCAVFLITSMVLTNVVWRRQSAEVSTGTWSGRADSGQSDTLLDLTRLVFKSRHLVLLVALVSLTMMVTSFIDFQFKAIVSTFFDTGLEKSAFFGRFYGRTSLLSFLVQLLLSYTFIRKLGVSGAVLVLPIGLLLGSGGMLVFAGLVSAVILRGADVTLRYSIDKTGRELLFLPLPIDIKKKTKVFIDLFVDRWFRGLAGGLLLLCIWLVGYSDNDPLASMKIFSVIVMALIAVWIAVAVLMRSEYINTFRRALERRILDPAEIRVDIAESATLRTLLQSVRSTNPREVAYALEVLAPVHDKNLTPEMVSLLDHREAEIRRGALRVLVSCGGSDELATVQPLENDPDPDVRREAFRFLYAHTPDREALLKRWCQADNIRIRSSMLGSLAAYGKADDLHFIDEDFVNHMLADCDREPAVRVEIARALGAMPADSFKSSLQSLLRDDNLAVRREALRATGRRQDEDSVPLLVSSLGDPNVRAAAREALSSFGARILPTLGSYLSDTVTPSGIRRALPRVIAGIPTQESVDLLTDRLMASDASMKYFLVKALNRLRTRHPELTFAAPVVDEVLIAETRAYYEILQVLNTYHSGSGTEAGRLFKKALQERKEQNMERIFRILGLSYPPEDIYSAYLGVVSNQMAMRASATEFLDNLLRGDIKRYLLPIIDDAAGDGLLELGRELFGIAIKTYEDALRFLIAGNDPWLRACAIFAAADHMTEPLRTVIRGATDDPDMVVRETAELALKRASA